MMNRAERRAAKKANPLALKAFVRYELPLSVLDLDVDDFAGTVAMHVAEGLKGLEDDGTVDVREMVVITIGRRKLGTEDSYGIEVKAVTP